MRIVGTVVTILVILGVSVGSCRFLAERPARPVPVGPVHLAYATEEVPAPPADSPIPTPTAAAGEAAFASGGAVTPPISQSSDGEPPAIGVESLPEEPSSEVSSNESPAAEPFAVTAASEPVPAALPKRGYASPGIGSPEAVALEEKTLDYLNWARARQGIPPYRLNPEMQKLAREQALLYVQTRENTGQYPPADEITAETRARRWFFREGGGPAPFEWLQFSFEEIAGNPDRNMSSLPYYRNPKGTEIGIGFAFYSGQGRVGEEGRTVRVVVWNGEWDR